MGLSGTSFVAVNELLKALSAVFPFFKGLTVQKTKNIESIDIMSHFSCNKFPKNLIFLSFHATSFYVSMKINLEPQFPE